MNEFFNFVEVDKSYPSWSADTRQELADAMQSYWVNFARTGKPGKGLDGNLPKWETRKGG